MAPANNSPYSMIARFILLALTLLATSVALWRLAAVNMWTQVFLGWLLVQLVFFIWVFVGGRARVLLPWTIVSVALALAYAFFAPMPITSMVVGIEHAPISAEVALNDPDQVESRGSTSNPRAHGWIDSDWISRHSIGPKRVAFLFDRRLGKELRNFEMRFGKHPAKFVISHVSLGTDILRIAVPLAQWRGSNLTTADFLTPKQTTLTLTDRRSVELLGATTRPTLGFAVDRSLANSTISLNRVRVVRTVWFAIFVAIPILGLLTLRSAGKVQRRMLALRDWLESTHGVPELPMRRDGDR